MRPEKLSSPRRAASFRRRDFRLAVRQSIEALEPRRLMAAGGETAGTIPPLLADLTTASNNSVALDQYFSDATVPGTLVQFNTSLGIINVALTDKDTPMTVANFLSYMNAGYYNGTFFHRSAFLDGSGTPSASTPSDIIQAGGYNISNGSVGTIPTNAPVDDEYTSEILKDTAGTLAMAKTSYANSATDQFYFNVNDNTQALDTPTTDPNGVTTSYTVFGQVVNVLNSNGLSVIQAIASLPVANEGGALSTLPVNGPTQAQLDAGTQPTLNQLVYINSVESEPGTSYTVTSDVPSLVTPTVSNGVLSFNIASGQYGTADITVKATNVDGTTASTIFPITVPNPAEPTQGPVLANSTSPAIQTGTKGAVLALSTATDSISPLTTSGVTIVTPPAHGTASVDPTTGYIEYTSTTGFVGDDTLTYTVTDEQGNVSNPATATIDVVPGPVQVTVGTASVKGLIFTEPDGAVGKLTVTNGTALVTFTNYQVSTPNVAGVIEATGAGTTITSITVTNSPGQAASLTVNSSSPVSLGSVNDSGRLESLTALNGTISGNCTFGNLNVLDVAATSGANILAPGLNVRITIGTATNTSLTANDISVLKSKQWLTTDGGIHTITAQFIGDLEVTGAFDEDLVLERGEGYCLDDATVGQPSGSWNLSASAFVVNVQTPASSWDFYSRGIIQDLNAKGTLQGVIEAAAISSVKVVGSSNGAVIQTDAAYNKRFLQLGRVSITGAATDTVIFSAGNVGTISAGSFSGTRIYAGITLAAAKADALPTDSTEFMNNARIASVIVGNGSSTFSNSEINAETLGSLRLGNISTTAVEANFGVTAHSISSITTTLGSVKPPVVLPAAAFKLTKDSTGALTGAASLAAYLSKKNITLPGGFTIGLY